MPRPRIQDLDRRYVSVGKWQLTSNEWFIKARAKPSATCGTGSEIDLTPLMARRLGERLIEKANEVEGEKA